MFAFSRMHIQTSSDAQSNIPKYAHAYTYTYICIQYVILMGIHMCSCDHRLELLVSRLFGEKMSATFATAS